MFNPKVSAALLCRFLIFGIPMLLAIYWPAASRSNSRILLGIHLGVLISSALVGMLWLPASYTRVEVRWLLLFAAYFALMLVSSVLAVNPHRSLYDWCREVLVLLIAFGLGRALRNRKSSAALGVASILAALSCGAFIVYLYLAKMGPQLPTYEQLRIFKGLITASYHVALNPLASSSVSLCIVSLATLKWKWPLRVSVAVVALIAGTMSGSRAPLALLAGSLLLLAIANLIQSKLHVHRLIGWTLAALLAVSAVAGVTKTTELQKSSVTEGRYDLWIVAWEKFQERPLTGYGAESWLDDFAGRLPNLYKATRQLKTIRAGGYHNEFLTVLAEEGILCFAAAILIFAFLLRDSFALAFHPELKMPGRQIILLGSIFLTLRAFIEVPGIFGYGDDVADYLAYIFMALLISRQSMVEDFSRRQSLAGSTRPLLKAAALPFLPSHLRYVE